MKECWICNNTGRIHLRTTSAEEQKFSSHDCRTGCPSCGKETYHKKLGAKEPVYIKKED